MAERLPIFPLNTVVFPGTVAPLHIFEERYRAMVRHLVGLEEPELRLFGIVALREGYEVGAHDARSLYRVGTVMQLTAVQPLTNGRFDVEAVGRQRMRIDGLATGGDFVVAELTRLADDPAEAVPRDTLQAEVRRTLAAFAAYRSRLRQVGGRDLPVGALPRDPEQLSYSLAAATLLPLAERQALLEAPSTRERLVVLGRMVRQELRAMRAVPSLPASGLVRAAWSPN